MANSELKYEKNPERYLIINASHVKYPFSDVILTFQMILNFFSF
jgi:hypothetical protein